jgi:NADPH:quinone reductase-like Zn-dependent oxidoreductase
MDLLTTVGLDVSGIVDAVANDVHGVAIGDAVFGAAHYAACVSAGAADQVIMKHWGFGLRMYAARDMHPASFDRSTS